MTDTRIVIVCTRLADAGRPAAPRYANTIVSALSSARPTVETTMDPSGVAVWGDDPLPATVGQTRVKIDGVLEIEPPVRVRPESELPPPPANPTWAGQKERARLRAAGRSRDASEGVE